MFFTFLDKTGILYTDQGIYHQVKLATRNKIVYAEWRRGFIKLSDKGATSNPKVRWETLEDEKTFGRDSLGRLTV
jgi:hypothetical protein